MFDLTETLKQLISLGKDGTFHWESLTSVTDLSVILVAWRGGSETYINEEHSELKVIDPESYKISIPLNRREEVLTALENTAEQLNGEFILTLYRSLRKEVNDVSLLNDDLSSVEFLLSTPHIKVCHTVDVNRFKDIYVLYDSNMNKKVGTLELDWSLKSLKELQTKEK